MMKKGLTMLLALGMLTASLAGCGNGASPGSEDSRAENPKGSGDASQSQGGQALGDSTQEGAGIVNETGYPIVNEPITLKIGIMAPGASYFGRWQDLEWTKKLQEESGINFEFVEYQDLEAVTLAYSTRDYPDVVFDALNGSLLKSAKESGDLYMLDEYIEKYAPNWNAYLQSHDLARKIVTHTDGHIYAFPIVREESPNPDIRDMWFIQEKWLKELNLEAPATVDEFYDVLKAFKENAGKGTIPEDVVPYYLYGVTSHIGGALDLVNSFGVRVSTERNFATVDENGKVEFNFVNEDIKEPLKFIHKLVEEGLVSKDGFADDWATYVVKITSADCNIGSFHAALDSSGNYIPIGPLDSGNGKEPLMRSQYTAVINDKFAVFKNCKYPEAAVRLADMIADPDWSMQGLYGMYDGTYMTKNEDGTMIQHNYGSNEQCLTSCPHNRAALLCTREMFDKLTYAEGSPNLNRQNAIKELYAGHIMSTERLYPDVRISDKNRDRHSELYTDISQYISTTFSKWALNGGIDEGWDEYISQLDKIGLDEYLEILQEELDAFNAN